MPTQEQLIQEKNALSEMREKQATCADQCAREKYWSELSIEEKIERTRQQIKMLSSQNLEVLDAMSAISRMRGDLVNHRHEMHNGVVTLPLQHNTEIERGPGSYRNRGNLGVSYQNEIDPEKVYF